MSEEPGEHRPWPAGLILLAAVGGICGWLFHVFGVDEAPGSWSITADPLRLALAAAAAGAALAFAWTLERDRWQWALLFAVGAAMIFLTIFYWNGSPVGGGADVRWRYTVLLIGLAAALPLCQAMRDEGRWCFPYVAVHWYAWTDVGAALVPGALLALGLALGLHHSSAWSSGWAWVGLGAGTALAIGLARTAAAGLDLQLPLRRLLWLLAPVMVLAVIAVPLLAWRMGSLGAACLLLALGSILLLNAVLGNGPEQQASNQLLRGSAMVLGAALLPLGLLAGAAVWMRIGEHGYSPSRLWAAVFALTVAAIGIRYLAALLRRKRLWAEPVRRNNVRVLGVLFLFGLLLSTPLLSFSSMATRDQIARLNEGKVRPAEFDWPALRFDFGRPGERALEELREGVETTTEVRSLAAQSLLAQQRSEVPQPQLQPQLRQRP